jgi:prepilin-type N-terminal cleavage/methylation domain-containing protein
MKNLKKHTGFTLIELLVAMSVFLVVLGLATGVFVRTFKTQRTITQLSESMNNVTLAIEQIARDVRTGINFTDTGETTVDTLRFTTGNGLRLAYEVIPDSQSIGRCVGSCGAGDSRNFKPITAPDVKITNMQFIVNSEGFHPPRVTILTTVMPDNNTEIHLQTSVSSRILD